MKKQLLFLATFLFASTMAFAQATISVDAVDQSFVMVSPLVTSTSTGTTATLSEGGSPSVYTQLRGASSAVDVAGTFVLNAQTTTGTVTGTISFDFRKVNSNSMAIKVKVAGQPDQTATYAANLVAGNNYQQLTYTYPYPVEFSTTAKQITFEITDLDNTGGATYSTVTSARTYDFKVTAKTLPLPSEATLDAGKIWYHNYSPDTFGITTTGATDGVFLEKASAVATPSTTGNSSTLVAKFTKTASAHSQVGFQLPGLITTANQSAAVFKIRAYVPSTNVGTTRNLRLFLRNGTSNAGQKNVTLPVTVFDKWQEYTFDFTGESLTEPSYSTVNILFDSPDSLLEGTNNVYYLDAFQGPLFRAVWTGATSTSWTEPTNWSTNAVPSTLTDVTIGTATNQPVIDANQAFNSLIIESGKSLTVNPGKVLTVADAITNAGSLMLKSSAAGTASLLSTASAAAANVTQERFLANNQRGWRLLSNPLATTTFSAITTASNITLGTGFTGAYDSTSNTWSSTDASASFETQKAYKVFITGQAGESPAYTTGPSNVTLSVSGTAANTAPSEMTTVATKYYLVANPYTAPVSLVSILAASTNLSNSVSYYNPTKSAADVKIKAGGYDAIIVSGVAGSATDVILPPMGAIFVQASADGTINVPKTAIFTGTTEAYNHKTAQSKTAAAVALTLDIASNGVDYDKLQLRFKEAGTTGSNIDFGKLPNSFLDFYSINEGNNMAISELELKEQTIALGVSSTQQKSFTLKVAENTIPVGYDAVLVDNVLNTNTVLAPGTTYDFAIDNSAASQGNARFAITLKTAGTLSVAANELDSKIQLWPNPAHNQFNITNAQNQNDGVSTIEISSVNGQVIHSQKSNPGTSTTIQTNSWAAGVYILKATNNGTQTTKKLIIQ